ncbi:hypothetical protein SDC9_27885 [bioreactor metagenome]|uniref:Uncharacterized protein n=1 Tax=bioreactor metagenome TaxID=1076179 RepID=A0A644USV3_9ZZZZ
MSILYLVHFLLQITNYTNTTATIIIVFILITLLVTHLIDYFLYLNGDIVFLQVREWFRSISTNKIKHFNDEIFYKNRNELDLTFVFVELELRKIYILYVIQRKDVSYKNINKIHVNYIYNL